MSKKFILVLLFLTLFSFKNFATHIVGGEIYYDCLGGNDYRITLKIYRDCTSPSNAPYDSAAYIFLFNSAGTFLDSITILFPGAINVPPTINNPCFTPPTNVCVQQAVYQTIIHLPPLAGGYDITYERCCRNGTILNLVNPGDVGSTYMAHIPDPGLASCNSSPRYNNFPPIYLCSGVPLVFDHSATDPDGDSLYYEFCDPFNGASPCCPSFGWSSLFIGPTPGCPGGCSAIPPPPPYPFVPWQTPYDANYPMSSSPAMSINHTTGVLTGTPNMIGQWVVGVCVSEYRGGVLLDVNKRDFQFNVVDCPGLPVAAVPLQSMFCFGYTAQFTQNSLNASSYLWNFGDPTTTTDISTAYAPTWTYPDSGTYTVTLIINPGTLCADTAVTTFDIQHLLAPSFVAPPGECDYLNSFNFAGGGVYQGTGTFAWNFGTHASPASSNQLNVNNVVFDAAGTFPVTFTISENGCTVDYTQNIHVYPKPIANYGLETSIACVMQPVHFLDSSQTDTPLSYEWAFGDGAISNEPDPFHTYGAEGNYATSLIISTSHGCVDTFALPSVVSVLPTPTAGFHVTPTDTSIFYPDINMVDESTGAIGCSISWGDGAVYTNCDSMHHYTKPGTYTLMQVVVNSSGCSDTAYSEVIIRPEFIFWIPNAFTPAKPDGLNDIFKPKLIGVYEYSFLIFDRWGEKIFETSDPDAGWDGYYKGHLCQNDVYVYKINFRDDVRKDQHEYIGRVTLVR